MTYLESLEDEQINANIEYLPDEKRYLASYPYNKELEHLMPNEEIAMKRAKLLESSLQKHPEDLALLNKTLKDSFDRGVFRFLSAEEMKAWKGKVHYVPCNRVYKDSESTPCRLVFDSGQPDMNGRSLNSCMGKGKNPLNYFGAVVLNFRAAEQVASGDISKMFNQVKVRDKDQHLRRFFCRPDGFCGKEDFQVAVITVINFGERAGGGVATAAKDRCADDFGHISPPVATMIKKDCFMDDIQIKAKHEESLDDNIKKAEDILANGSFSFKSWVKSGEKAVKEIGKSETDPNKALGMHWHTESDTLCYKVRLNFSKKS